MQWSLLKFVPCGPAAPKFEYDAGAKQLVEKDTGRCLSVLDCKLPFKVQEPWGTYSQGQ